MNDSYPKCTRDPYSSISKIKTKLIKNKKGARDIAQLTEHLYIIHKALGSVPCTTKI
jgi:hypothetical protein